MSGEDVLTDPEACAVCFAPMNQADLESYSLVYWDPVTAGYSLVQMFCPQHRPLPAPQWLRRESEQGAGTSPDGQSET